ncbi:coiled-coil domain-containing protein mad1 [Recurvomyces mirabilis]|nr:coiled-coil domain-containing protein mad1 [Recurvomyces mirabilis]
MTLGRIFLIYSRASGCEVDRARVDENGSGGVEASPARQPLRETLKQSTVSRADINNENIRAQLNTLQYELDSLKQERELTNLHHQQEVRDALSRSENDFKRAQAAEAASNAAKAKSDALVRELQVTRDRATNERLGLEKKVRSLQEDCRVLREEVEEVRSEVEGKERASRRACEETEQKYDVLKASVDGIQEDLGAKVKALQGTQQRLVQREAEVGRLEEEVLGLKQRTGDSETLAVVQREAGEQRAYILRLEAKGRGQEGELKGLRAVRKGVEVVEEEKRGLEAKVAMLEELRRELAEVQLQRRILEDERSGWTSYLEAQGEEGVRFETAEEMARAFLQERVERLSLVDRLGAIQPELVVKEENIRSLEDEKAGLQAEMKKLRTAPPAAATNGPADGKVRLRLERQRNLMTKEVEYLRAQMKTFEAEEAEFNLEQIDEERMKRIHELEDMVEKFRSEVQALHVELSKAEAEPPAPTSDPLNKTPLKRSREEDETSDERLGELRRKTRTLQTELETRQTRIQLLEAELKATNTQIASLKETAQTRILSLRDNPTSEAEAIKLTTLTTLRAENTALLSQLEGRPNGGVKVVPISILDSTRLLLKESQTQIAAHEKKTLRLKQIWSAKSLEFREAVCSILGWKLDFLPNGRVKATSILYPSTKNGDGEEEENSIIFDGENGTMKVSGGPRSAFAGEIRGLIEFWVEGRGEVPCFLAACTLEFWERGKGAAAG